MSQKNFTTKALAVMEAAQQAAAMRYNQEITSAHVLLALAKEPEGLLATIFEECNTDLPMLKARVEKESLITELLWRRGCRDCSHSDR